MFGKGDFQGGRDDSGIHAEIRSGRQGGAGHRRLARHRARLRAGLRRLRRRHDRRRAQALPTARRLSPKSKRIGRRALAVRDGSHRSRYGANSRRRGARRLRPHRRAGQQCRRRAGKPGRERHRGRFRLHRQRQPQGHVLHHAGGGETDDRAEIRAHHQHQLAGRHA